MSKTNKESAIRAALRKRHLRHYRDRDDVLVVDELGLAHSRGRIDVAVFNGYLHGYEIKSSSDTLERLPRQLALYRLALQRLTLVVAARHLDSVCAMVPDWCGLVEIVDGPQRGITVVPRRRARMNPELDPFVLLHLLWRAEAQALLRERGVCASDLDVPRKQLYRTLADEVPVRELVPSIKAAMASRTSWRDHPRQS